MNSVQFHVICQKRGRELHHEFQTPRNRWNMKARDPKILGKINGKPRPPTLPKSRMGKWRVFALRAASSLICGGWGFAVPFYFVQDWRPSAFICFTGTTSIARGTWINLLQMQINSVMKTDVLQIGHKPNWALSLVFKKELGWSWPRELKKKLFWPPWDWYPRQQEICCCSAY